MFEDAMVGLLDMFLKPIETIVRMFPAMPAETQGLWPEQMAQYLTWFGNIFDLDALTIMVSTIVTFEISLFAIRLTLKIYKLLPLT